MSEKHVPTSPRIVRRIKSARSRSVPLRPAEWPQMLLDYFGFGKSRRRLQAVTDVAGLEHFLESRASFIAQTSLYGYLRTRSGMRYPELFDDDPFVEGINIAKWHIWLDCLGDLAIYAGGLLARESSAEPQQIGALMQELVDGILARTMHPPEAGGEFPEHSEQLRARIAECDWTAFEDGEWAFSASPAAVVKWSPVMDRLKQFDEEIVKNSVRFRWQEVRRDLRQCLDAEAVLGAMV